MVIIVVSIMIILCVEYNMQIIRIYDTKYNEYYNNKKKLQ